jgi:hypothetical protein
VEEARIASSDPPAPLEGARLYSSIYQQLPLACSGSLVDDVVGVEGALACGHFPLERTDHWIDLHVLDQ